MAAANAWLLDFGDGISAAIGERELFHLVYDPKAHALPRTPAHCSRVIEWEGRILPLWDLPRRISRGAASTATSLVAVVGYQSADGRTEFGGLSISAPPQRVTADDVDACPLPEDRPAWRAVTKSCFTRAAAPVPVLDLPAMFAPRT